MQRLTVAAIVLGLDRYEDTRACVTSLRASRGCLPRILVFDNGSSDGTGGAIEREFSDVEVRHSPVNLGAAAGRNQALSVAVELWEPDLLLFVDDDAEVHPDAVASLERTFRDPGNEELGAAAAKILYPGEPARIYAAGGSGTRLWLGDTAPRGQGEKDVGQYDRPEPCVPGTTCTMFRAAAIRDVGGFDPGFDPYGYEDLDLSLRLIEHGWRILYVPDAVAWHERDESPESGRRSADYAAMKRRNWMRFLRRHGSHLDRLGFWLVGGPTRLLRSAWRAVRGDASALLGFLGLHARR